MKNRKMKKWGLALLTTAMLLGASGVTSFAQTNEGTGTEEVLVEQPVEQKEESKNQETAFSTPGNGQLVDDKGSDSTKQFLTIRTKNGNTFYMIIDRAGNTENVYMMSLVDENDLAEFVDKPMQSDKKEPDVVLPETSNKTEEEPSKPSGNKLEAEKEETQKGNPMGYLVLGGCFIFVGGGVIVYVMKQMKKKKEEGVVEEGLEYMEDKYINEEEEQRQKQNNQK